MQPTSCFASAPYDRLQITRKHSVHAAAALRAALQAMVDADCARSAAVGFN